MYNRFIHQQQQINLQKQLSKSATTQRLNHIRKKSNQKMSQKYKERIRDFLVQVTSKPLVLGQYQPPIKNIVRNPQNQKILANAQLYISGFKTNKERIQKAVEENQILDLSPTTGKANTYDHRPRDKKIQIQPGMRFAGKAQSLTKLPQIKQGKQSKLRFKGVQEMGNNLKSMKQREDDKIGLINRLQTVSGGKQLDHITFSVMALRQSKILRPKYKK